VFGQTSKNSAITIWRNQNAGNLQAASWTGRTPNPVRGTDSPPPDLLLIPRGSLTLLKNPTPPISALDLERRIPNSGYATGIDYTITHNVPTFPRLRTLRCQDETLITYT